MECGQADRMAWSLQSVLVAHLPPSQRRRWINRIGRKRTSGQRLPIEANCSQRCGKSATMDTLLPTTVGLACTPQQRVAHQHDGDTPQQAAIGIYTPKGDLR